VKIHLLLVAKGKTIPPWHNFRTKVNPKKILVFSAAHTTPKIFAAAKNRLFPVVDAWSDRFHTILLSQLLLDGLEVQAGTSCAVINGVYYHLSR
jgi:hypothetical protein